MRCFYIGSYFYFFQKETNEIMKRCWKRSVGHDPQRAKALSEWRAAEAKNKSKCYANAKDNERVQDAVLDCKLGRGRDGRTRSFCQDEPNHDFCGSFEGFFGENIDPQGEANAET